MSHNSSSPNTGTENRTISDFGEQWKLFPDPTDQYHSSPEIFADTLQGLFDPEELKGRRVVEIGSGSGRVLEILRRYDPAYLVGVEPSENAESLVSRFSNDKRVKILQSDGATPLNEMFDTCFVIGVLHHIPKPLPVLKNVRSWLNENGSLVVWVYGREGRAGAVVLLIRLARVVTVHLPDRLVLLLSRSLAVLVRLYGLLASRIGTFGLPMREYLLNVFLPCSRAKQTEIIFDQLNPRCARYYTREELRKLLSEAGFGSVEIVWRHGYSITAVARR